MFDPKPVYVGFVVDKVVQGQVFYEYFVFPLAVSFHQSSIYSLIYCRRSIITAADSVIR